ncbi:MAG: diguanylate cyclase [Spirochaetia bacterium]|nr:diguanylate cyclase [Spirochaetia bacterium]
MSISIEQLERKLKEVLEGEHFSTSNFDGESPEDLLLELSVYHQELEYQNEELRRIQLVLEESKQFYTDLFEHAPINYLLYDQNLFIKHANSTCRQTLNVNSVMIEGHSLAEFIHPDSQDAFYLHLRAVQQSSQKEGCSLDLVKPNHGRIRVKMQSNVVVLNKQRLIRSAFIDMSKEYEQQKKIEHLTFKDQLTGLFNRTYFEQMLDDYLAKDVYPLGILVGDMNALKLANDTFGHEVGDALLVALANVLQAVCLQNGMVFRFGGDEFVCFIANADEQMLRTLIRQIEQECKQVKIGPVELSASFGFALKNDSNMCIKAVMRHAEDLMYQNKLFCSKAVRQSLVGSLIESLFAKNREQHIHAEQARKLAKQIASCLGLSANQLEDLFFAAYVHDLGKLLSVSEDSLDTHHRRHPEKGYRVLSSLGDQHAVAEAVLYHHERWDGKGYPMGLKGEDIPFLARVLTLVDIICWYKKKHPQDSKEDLKAYLKSLAASSLDPHLIETLMEKDCV